MYNLTNSKSLSPLLQDIGDRPVVLLGEASHGTHEYYTWRTALSKRLIQEKGFRFIAVEGDWPDCYLLNRYIKGYSDAGTNAGANAATNAATNAPTNAGTNAATNVATTAARDTPANARPIMQSFDRWPTWMWANWEVIALIEWMREYNDPLPQKDKVGFYGLDVYSLWDSMKVMMDYLNKEDKQAAQWVKKAITCFEPYREDEHTYARHSLSHNCREEVITLLKEIRARAQFLDGDREAGFNTEQNALIAVNAERYYRSMTGFNDESWNIRDRHMMETLQRLLSWHGAGAKGIVWEHNTHIGDARATDMAQHGMVNIGQLARDQYGIKNVYSVGFGGYRGTVIAGEQWGAPMEEMEVPPAREESVEALLHRTAGRDHYILFDERQDRLFDSRIPHRAIGVVYNPATERRGNYVPSVLSQRYDAFVYLEETSALHPLHLQPHDQKIPETYPFGL